MPFTLSLRWAAAAYLGSGSEELNEFMIFLQIRKCKQRLQRTMPSKVISKCSGSLTNIFRQQWCHTPCYYIFFLPTIFFSVDLIAAICYTSCWGRRKGGKEGKGGGKDLVTMTGHTVRGGVSLQKNWIGVCSALPETLTLLQTKISDFPYPISDLPHNQFPSA